MVYRLLTGLLALLPASLLASGWPVFAWDHARTDCGFRLYAGATPGSQTLKREVPGDWRQARLGLPAGRWYVTATAVDPDGLESDPSDEVVVDVVDGPQPGPRLWVTPGPVIHWDYLGSVTIEATENFTDWSPVFTGNGNTYRPPVGKQGFFRGRIN